MASEVQEQISYNVIQLQADLIQVEDVGRELYL